MSDYRTGEYRSLGNIDMKLEVVVRLYPEYPEY
jgi:hypothetical protein